MTLETAVILYITISFILLNCAWVYKLSVLPRIKNVFAFYFAEFCVRLALVFYTGILLDKHFTNAPHQFYNDWQTYVTFIIAMVTFSIPGVVYYYYRRKEA